MYFKNFIMLLKRYTTSSLLNILGMAVAFAAVYIIMVQVNFDLSYNKGIPNAQNIYRLEHPDWSEEGYWGTTWPRQLPDDLCKDIPEIVKSATITPTGHYNINSEYSRRITDRIDHISLNLCEAEREGLEILGIEVIEGSLDNVIDHYTLVLKESVAKRFNLSVGDVLCYGREASEENTAVVVAICKDTPSPSILDRTDGWGGMEPQENENPNNWNNPYYIQLADGASPEAVAEKLKASLPRIFNVESELYADEETVAQFIKMATPRLSPLTELYFTSDVSASYHDIGSRTVTYTLITIAVLIIVIAMINFVNFFFALIPVRIKSINTCKVFGASSFTLRLNFVFETVGLVLVALCGSAAIVGVFMETPLTEHISTSIAIGDNVGIAVAVAALSILAGIIVSIYPAWYITRFSPAMVMGGFQATAPGKRLRYTLVAVQYFISITLIICSLFIHIQQEYMLSYDMGFEKENLLVVNNLPGETVFESFDYENGFSQVRRDAFAESLLKNPAIVDVAFADGSFVAPTRMQWGRNVDGKGIYFDVYPVSWDFLQLMKIDIVDGRDFCRSDEFTTEGVFIFNEDAARKINIKAGDKIPGHRSDAEVVGICRDFNYRPMQYNIEPFAFYIFGKYPWRLCNQMYVRTAAGADISAVKGYIMQMIAEYAPNVPTDSYDVTLFDAGLEELYQKEEQLSSLITLFTMLSILISVIGVFGLVLFETQYRRKEIGIRRVHGSSVVSILKMFNIMYLRIVAICSLVAVPVSYLLIDHWLQQFAYRAKMAVWVYLLAVVIVVAITVVTVTIRAYKTANENPVDAISR
ncbi:MAG: FtsX-like permease family protein [Bacteroidales bacterium]|nr:FtsX-like permease family protein [Bacteroidales bacterium]